MKTELESHIRDVGEIIGANLVSDGENAVVDAEAVPTADASAPEVAVAGPVPAESVGSDSESNSSIYSGSEAPQGE